MLCIWLIWDLVSEWNCRRDWKHCGWLNLDILSCLFSPRSLEYCPEYMHFHSILSKRNYVVLSDGHAILLHFFLYSRTEASLRWFLALSRVIILLENPKFWCRLEGNSLCWSFVISSYLLTMPEVPSLLFWVFLSFYHLILTCRRKKYSLISVRKTLLYGRLYLFTVLQEAFNQTIDVVNCYWTLNSETAQE